jgi:hypothetical protein
MGTIVSYSSVAVSVVDKNIVIMCTILSWFCKTIRCFIFKRELLLILQQANTAVQ